MALLEVEDLVVQFYTEDGVVRAVDGISYEIERGERFGIVGESGAGKSATSLSVLRLLDTPGEIVSGEIRFQGRNVLDLSERELRDLRGNEIAMVFQDAEAALNPVYTIGEQIAEAIQAHNDVTDDVARNRSIELLERVGLPDPATRYTDYPHELSGGMAQRVLIAMALSCEPALLVCDEPTTALDVTIEAQLLELLDELATEFEMAIQLVSHDLGVVAELCSRVMVMYAGQIVERAPVEELFYEPKHPYTVGLMAALPRLGTDRDRLPTIPGSMPDMVQVPTGCRFHPRCPYAEETCARREPALVETESGQDVAAGTAIDHVAACHEYTGDLEHGLDYEVRVRDRGGDEGEGGGGGGSGDRTKNRNGNTNRNGNVDGNGNGNGNGNRNRGDGDD